MRTLTAFDRAPQPPLAGLRTFLILEHASALGTVIHATPLIPALRAAVPDARIIVAASGFGLEIFRDNPGVTSVLPMPNPTRDFRAAVRRLREIVRSEGPLATLTPVGNERSAIGIASYLAGAANRVGFTLTPELSRAPMTFDFARSQIANNLRIVEALGHAPPAHFEPQVFFSESDISAVRSRLGSPYDPQRPLAVLVTQTSPTQRKSWRAERFAAAAQFLIDRHNAQLVFVGTESERAAVESIRQLIRGDIWNLAGETNLKQLAALLSLCSIGLTLDTGTLHLGRAVGLPMVVIAPAWSPPLEWLPLGNPCFRILKNLTLESAPADYIIDEVSVDEVTAALADLLQRYPRPSAPPAHPAR